MAIKKKNVDMETLDKNGNIKEKIHTYPNGATLLYYNQNVNKTTSARVAFVSGAQHDPKGKEGLAHFLEHMLVGHGNWKLNQNKVFETFRDSDAEFNALTSFDNITFIIDCPSQNVDKIAEIWSELIFDPKFTDAGINEEVETISAEIDLSARRGLDSLIAEIANRDLSSEKLTGTKESIRNIKVEDLYEFHRRHFCSENMVISVVSDLPFEEVKQKMEQYFINKAPSKPKNKNRALGLKLEFDENKFFDYFNPMQRDCEVEFTLFKKGSMEEFKRYSDLEDFVLNGFTGRLYQALRMDKQLVYSTSYDSVYDCNSIFRYIGLSTNYLKLNDCIDRVIKVLNDLKENGITEKEFEAYKNMLPFRKDKKTNFRYVQPDTLLSRFLEKENVFMDMEKINPETLTYEEANEYIKKSFSKLRFAYTLAGAYNDKTAPTLEMVEARLDCLPKIIKKAEEYLDLTLKDLTKIMVNTNVDEEYKDEVINTFDVIFQEVAKMGLPADQVVNENLVQQEISISDVTPEMIAKMPLETIGQILKSPGLTLQQIYEFKAKVEKVIESSIKVDVAKMPKEKSNKQTETTDTAKAPKPKTKKQKQQQEETSIISEEVVR